MPHAEVKQFIAVALDSLNKVESFVCGLDRLNSTIGFDIAMYDNIEGQHFRGFGHDVIGTQFRLLIVKRSDVKKLAHKFYLQFDIRR